MLGKRYEVYLAVLEGQAGGPLIYLGFRSRSWIS
jgi:hypothetical protein